MTAITALTAQNNQGVHGIHDVPIDFIVQADGSGARRPGRRLREDRHAAPARSDRGGGRRARRQGQGRAGGRRSGDGRQGRRVVVGRRGGDHVARAAVAAGQRADPQPARGRGIDRTKHRHARGRGRRRGQAGGHGAEGGADEGRPYGRRDGGRFAVRERRADRGLRGRAPGYAQHARHRLHHGLGRRLAGSRKA